MARRGAKSGAGSKRRRPAAARYGLLVADAQGQFGDEPFLEGAARSGFKVRAPRREELSPWIEEAPLQFLPGRQPLAWPAGRVQGPPRPLEGESWAVVTLPPAGWVRTLLPAWRVTPGAEDLPIFGYTPLFVREGELYWAALPLELNLHWDPKEYDKPSLEADIEATKRALPGNRLLEQLAICAREYGCCNAQNIFYGRWEGAVPISPQCNARCRGCISKQPAGGPPSPQIRLDFTPTVEEIAQLALFHLRRAPDPILSFGQGCEGEPLLQAERAAQAVRLVRAQEGRGTLHMNSNGSLPQKAQLLFEAGLDSMRISLCSALEESYVAYYQPQHYKFRDVLETIERGRAAGVWISLNLLFVPGLNDTPRELEALIELIQRYGVNMLQLRNLNGDPDWLLAQMARPGEEGIGIPQMIATLRRECPALRLGTQNPPVRP